jgi:hypothetical protein
VQCVDRDCGYVGWTQFFTGVGGLTNLVGLGLPCRNGNWVNAERQFRRITGN